MLQYTGTNLASPPASSQSHLKYMADKTDFLVGTKKHSPVFGALAALNNS